MRRKMKKTPVCTVSMRSASVGAPARNPIASAVFASISALKDEFCALSLKEPRTRWPLPYSYQTYVELLR